MSKSKKVPTPEEYEKDKQTILTSYKSGLPVRRMTANFGYSRSYIAKIRDVLISEGLITEDEIKLASEKYYKENPSSQGLDKRRVRKPKGTEKSEKRHKKSLENREEVYKLVKKKYIKAQIARKLQISERAVEWHIKKLIEERKN